MDLTRNAALAAAMTIAFVFPTENCAGSVREELVSELQDWIDTATDLPRANSPATIVFVGSDELPNPSEMASMIGTVPRGLYDPSTGTISLVRPWSEDNPQDVAVLLHELVHHRQGERYFYCEAAKEHAAYHIQKNWLEERGLILDVNWIAVVLASSCAPRDVHP